MTIVISLAVGPSSRETFG